MFLHIEINDIKQKIIGETLKLCTGYVIIFIDLKIKKKEH